MAGAGGLRVVGCWLLDGAWRLAGRLFRASTTCNRQPATAARQRGRAAVSRPGGASQEKARGLVRVASRGGGPGGAITAGYARRGFTLLEIVVVLAIIAAATVLGAMATTGGFERMRVHSSTAQIAANLRYTRAQAISSGRPQRFVVDPQTHAWQAPNGRHGKVPDSLGLRFFGAREVQPSAGTGAIVFFDDGASTGGRVQVAGKHSAWNVEVAWLTGEVSLQRAEKQR